MAKMGFEGRTVHFDWHNKRPEKYGYTFKSDQERKWADYLELLKLSENIESWEYEPKQFQFEERLRKKGVYTPDFHVEYAISDEWHEVKTSLRQKDIYRLKQFRTDFPNEKIVLILNSCPKRSINQIRLVENARKYVNEIIYAAPIFRKLGI